MRQLLPDVPNTIFRPSIVLGDSRYPETTQFDMVKAFVFLAGLPVLPFRPKDKIDIVNVDFVADAIATLHQKENPLHDTYHLSSGTRVADFPPVDHRPGRGAEQTWPHLPSVPGKTIRRDREFPVQPARHLSSWRIADEGVHALSGVEHGIRQHTRHPGTGTQAGAIFAIQLIRCSSSAAKPISPIPIRNGQHQGGRVRRMMDLVLEAWVSSSIEAAKLGWMMGKGKPWQPGEKLKLLFAGYNGTRNMGSDVRVSKKCCGRLRHILGADNIAFSVMTQNFKFTDGYFEGTRQVHLPDIFPPFLSDEVPRHHGVVACEGSMFKSKFANALTTMMIGSLGIAAAQNKLSVGYGAEAGHMDPLIAKNVCALLPEFVRHHSQ